MSDAALPSAAGRIDPTPTDWHGSVMQARIRQRYAAEKRFKLWGLAAILASAG